jgi:hypothetical protein
MATTEQLRRAFGSLHGRHSPTPAVECTLSTTSCHNPSLAATATASARSSSPLYCSSPLSSPSPSPVFFSPHAATNAEDGPYGPLSALLSERRTRTRSHKECAHCGTTESSQWRRGPFDKAKYMFAPPMPSWAASHDRVTQLRLCNACGLRYSRNFAKKRQQKDDRQRAVAGARELTVAATTAPPRSDIYDLLN